MIKYRAKTQTWGQLIEKINVERETKKCVWIDGRRSNKMSDWYCYFDTFGEAKNYLISEAENKVQAARSKLNNAKSHLGNIQALKE